MGGRIRYIESEFVSKNCQSSLPGRDLVVNLGIVRWMGWLRCIDFCADSLGDTYGLRQRRTTASLSRRRCIG